VQGVAFRKDCAPPRAHSPSGERVAKGLDPARRAVSTDRPIPDDRRKAHRFQEPQAGNDEQRARAVRSERGRRSSVSIFESPEHFSHGRHSRERREVKSSRHKTRRRAVRPQAARSVANRSKRSTERQSRRGHCVGVNAATTTNIWARDPDVQRVDAPPLFGEGERALECVSPLRWAEDRCPSRVTATGTSSSCIVHGRAVRRHRCSH
jgi:hypothetical protein